MTTENFNITHSQNADVCRNPDLGILVPDYILELLDDASCLIVEQHLAECVHCKERYLTVLRMRATACFKKQEQKKTDDEVNDDDRELAKQR
ncbi:MAG TPA: zf-HC2 domain-containing protein [Pyrinomonadaceae bacterium]